MTTAINIIAFWEYVKNFSYSDAYYLQHYPNILPWSASILYLIMVFGLPKVMKKGLPSSIIDPIMAIWNLLLSLMSAVILILVIPSYLQLVDKFGFLGPDGILCDKVEYISDFRDPMTYCGYLFAWSKYIELFDTLWIILKNPSRKGYAAYWRLSVGFLFCIMNAFIHTFMYFYYFLTSIGIRPEFMAMPLTIAQISQMFMGIIIMSYWTYLYLNGAQCACRQPNILVIACIVMYGSYLYLFVDFFIKRYFGKKKKEKTK